MKSVAIKLSTPAAIRAACELSIAQGEQYAQVMYKSEHFEDHDYVGADLEEFAVAKDDPDEFEEFCGGRRHSWELWVYEKDDASKDAEAVATRGEEFLNQLRAGYAAELLSAGRHYQDDDPVGVQDLLSDLMHFCQGKGYDFSELLRVATDNFNSEVMDAEFEGRAA